MSDSHRTLVNRQGQRLQADRGYQRKAETPQERKERLRRLREEAEIVRVDGDALCPECSEPYREHPWDKLNLDYRGEPYLRVGCDGARLKL